MWKVFLIWFLGTVGISILEFIVWFLFLWFVLRKRNIKVNVYKALLFSIPTKIGLATYYIRYGYGDIKIFKAMWLWLWKLCSEKILDLRAKYGLLHYSLCIVELSVALLLGLTSWIITPILLIGGGLVVLFIKYIISPVVKFYEKKIQVLSFWESWKNGMIELERVFRYPKIF